MKEKFETITKAILNNKNKTTSYLVKRIVITNLLSLAVIGVSYIWVIYLLSNANSFWSIFKGKDLYVQKDTVPPLKPYLNPIPEATKQDSLDITGQSEAGVKVVLKIDGKKAQETVADSNGKFSFASIPVGVSSQVMLVEALDESGNTSLPSQTYTILKDTENPVLEILTPSKDNETFKSTGRTYKVSGKSEPGNTIHINEQLAVVSTSGEFFASIRLEDGSNQIKIKAVDKAGNEMEETRNVVYEKID